MDVVDTWGGSFFPLIFTEDLQLPFDREPARPTAQIIAFKPKTIETPRAIGSAA